MSLQERSSDTPTRPPRIPQQRTTSREFVPTPPAAPDAVAPAGSAALASRWLAVLRITTGAAFLWAVVSQATGTATSHALFLIGLAAIGVAVVLGVGLRISAVAGGVLVLLGWGAAWTLAAQAAAGSGATPGPVGDLPPIYALVLVVLAVTYAGRTWGFGARWATLPVVRRHRWLV